jgi:hypothetical protein
LLVSLGRRGEHDAEYRNGEGKSGQGVHVVSFMYSSFSAPVRINEIYPGHADYSANLSALQQAHSQILK